MTGATHTTATEYEFPLSHQQLRLWFLDQLRPGDPAYNMPIALRLHGPLDVSALDRALQTIVDRHEVLRTRYVTTCTQPTQLVSNRAVFPLSYVDLRGAPGRAVAVASAVSEAPFDLASAAPLRACLLSTGRNDHMLLIVVHHIACDGWSVQVLADELTTAYRTLCEERVPALPDLAVQYGDFASWQRQRSSAIADLDYWRRELAGAPATLDLPTDRPRSTATTRPAGHVHRTLDDDLADEVDRTVHAHGFSLAMILLAAYGVVLGQFAGRNVCVIGTPSAGRSRWETRGLIGCFVELLPMRVDLSGDPTAADLLDQVKETCLAGYAHQDVPFDRLVEVLRPERYAGHHPVFEVLLNVQENPPDTPSLPDIQVIVERPSQLTARFDITLDARRTGTRLALDLEYDHGLFEHSTAERLIDRLIVALDWVTRRDGSTLSCADLAPPGERSWLHAASHGPATPLHGPTIPDVIRHQADADPTAVAVLDGSGAIAPMSRSDLLAKAERVASGLGAAGIARGDLVGVALRRSPQLVPTLLGIWLTGAAFVPLDPKLPRDRLAFMAADSHLAVTVSDTGDASGVPNLRQIALSQLDTSQGFEPVSPNHAEVAYVSYTSGSTGLPKGVVVPHSAVANLIGSMITTPGLSASDRMVAVTTPSFDIAVLELFGPLCAGGHVVVVSAAQAQDPCLLAELLDDCAATVIQATPSTWRMLTDSGWSAARPLTVWSGGEPLPPDLAETLLATGHPVWNLYGPTETTIWSTCGRVQEQSRVNIGGPVANTDIHLLDERSHEVPAGAIGEIHIGGAGLAHGYLHRPGLSAERFVPDPHGDGRRLYRTGDLGRWNTAGQLECLGRTDRQVKVRGHRVEPGEVELMLTTHPDIAQAHVTQYEGELVGYLVPVGDLDIDAVRAWAHDRLPRHFVPATLVMCSELPLTPNNKIDTTALPVPTSGPTHGATSPRSPQEERVVECFARTLNKTAIGVDDDFFDSGGTSLSAVRLVTDIERRIGAQISLRELFLHPTAASVAAFLDANTGAADQPVPAAPPPDDIAPAPLHPRAWTMAHVLLTGATGFLGHALLERLVLSGATVTCLVRANDDIEALARLHRAVAVFALDPSALGGRVRVVAGDITAPRLGLGPTAYEDLAENVTDIFHSAARVSFAEPYSKLAIPNVTGTAHVVRFAAETSGKVLHYISTLDLTAGVDGAVLERRYPPLTTPPAGYVDSKRAGEMVVTNAADHGLAVTIIRPWLITAHRITGATAGADQLTLGLRAALVTGLVPDVLDLPIHVMPVDEVARVLVELGKRPSAGGRIIHLLNPRSAQLRDVVDLLRRSGHHVDVVSPKRWADAVQRSSLPAEAAALARLFSESPVHDLPLVDTAAATQLLGQPPNFGTLTESYLGQVVEYLRAHRPVGGVA